MNTRNKLLKEHIIIDQPGPNKKSKNKYFKYIYFFNFIFTLYIFFIKMSFSNT